MRVTYSELPGRHERHLRRRAGNPLFPRSIAAVGEAELLEVQRLDHEELLVFLTELRGTVQRAVSLKSNEQTQVVLDLKADLERLYETAAGLPDEQDGNKTAIRQLVAVIAQTVRSAASGDPLATTELEMEETARAAHFALLEQPLVAELLHPESLIEPDELAPTLLSETEAAVAAALQLFDPAQLAAIAADARRLLERHAGQETLPAQAWQRLTQIEQRLRELRPSAQLN